MSRWSEHFYRRQAARTIEERQEAVDRGTALEERVTQREQGFLRHPTRPIFPKQEPVTPQTNHD